jgi:ribosomal protein L39E
VKYEAKANCRVGAFITCNKNNQVKENEMGKNLRRGGSA